ncbi:MAG: hypothetical protein ACYSWU_02365 [Planctomycetota bacterium]
MGLRRGKHTIRVLLSDVGLLKKGSGGERDVILFGHNEFEAISNPVEIEIGRDEPAADGEKAIPSAEPSDRRQGVVLRGADESCRDLCLDVDDEAKVEQIDGATSARCLRLAKEQVPDARWTLIDTERGHLIQAQFGKFAGWYLDYDDDAEIGEMGGATSSRNLLLTKEKVPGAHWKVTKTDRGHLIQAQAERFTGWYLDLDLLTQQKVEGAFWEIEEKPWGKAVDGVQCRLLPKKSTWKAGRVPQIQADLRNRGKRELSMGLAPESWEVQFDGVWYRTTARSSGGVELLWLEPGAQRNGISLLLEQRWRWQSKEGNEPLVFKPGKHTMRAAFKPNGGSVRVVSHPIKIEIVVDQSAIDSEKTPWGKAVEGVQCRLRPDKLVWKEGDNPTFKVDIRNKGVRELKTSLIASLAVEVDGEAYAPHAWIRLGRIPIEPFGPGAEYTIDFPLSEFGSRDKGAEELSPGKHTIRVVLLNNRDGRGIYTSLENYKQRALAFSNPVEIEIVADQPAAGAEATARREAVERVAFYLLDQPVPSSALRGDLSKLKLAQKPLLTLEDIVASDPQSNGLLVKEPARKRLFEGTAWPGESGRDREFTEKELEERRAVGRRSVRPSLYAEPFVVVVDGKRILGGHIASLASSPFSCVILHAPPNKPVQFHFPEKEGKAFIAALKKAGKLVQWGPAVEGVQVRLRADRPVCSADEAPTFKVDLRNGAKSTLYDTPGRRVIYNLEFDGHWYMDPSRVRKRPLAIPAYEQHAGGSVLPLSPENWRRTEPPRTLELTPGKHTVRVAFVGMLDAVTEAGGGKPVRAASNPVEIEIVADKPPPDAGEAAALPAEAYRKHVANLVLPQRDDPYLPSQKWLRERLAGAVPYLLEARIKYKDQFNRIPVVADLLFEAWEQGLLSNQQKRTLLENTLLVGWDLRGAYPPGYASEAMVNFRGVLVSMGLRPHEPGDTWKRPLGPEGILKAAWRVELDGKEIRRGETNGSDGFLLRFPDDLDTGNHPLKATLEVSERRGQWRHSWTRSGQFRIDPELKPQSIVAPGSENFPQEKAVRFVEGSAKQFEWDSGGEKFLVTAPAIKIEPAAGFDMDIVARLPIEVEIDGKISGKPHYYGGYSHIDGHSPPGRQFTFQPSPDVSLRPGKLRWRIALVPDLYWAWTEPGVDRLCNRKFLSPWYTAELESLAGTMRWGRARNGLQAGLVFDLQDRPYRVGELVRFGLCVRNLSNKVIKLVDFGTRGWMPTVRDSAGNPVAVAGQFSGPVQRRLQSFPAGWILFLGTVELKLDEKPGERSRQPPHAYLKPGTYRVSQKYRFADDPEATWSGELSTGELELKVVAAEPGGGPKPPLTVSVRGRVIDHQGKPVVGAKVFSAGGTLHPRGFYDGSPSSKIRTDNDGRFVLSDVDKRATHVLVSAPSFRVWKAPLPEPGRELQVKLPKPAILRIRYDIQGADDQARFRLQLMTWEMEGWKQLAECVQNPTVPNKGEVTLTGLTPGVYDLARVRHLRGHGLGMDVFCDRRLKLTLAAGTTNVLHFAHEAGQPVTGRLAGLPQDRLQGAFVYVKDARATGDPRNGDPWIRTTFDAVTTDAHAQFTTARIPPGTYAVIAESYEDLDRSGRPAGMGEPLPDFVGTARVTVPEQGQPPQVRIEMKTLKEFEDALRAAEAKWGPAVEGVQCRLEADKPTWKAAEMLTLKAYVRHHTETRLFLSNHPSFGAQLEVDGHWHRWSGSMEWTGPAHSSSKFRTKDGQLLKVTLDVNWKQVDNKQPLRLDPGRHVVRFAWEGFPERGPREGPDQQREIALVSNPVEITILPDSPQPKLADVHPDDKDAAAALQRVGAILAVDDQGRIRSVRLSRTAVTDAGLVHLSNLSELKAVYLDDTRITDAGLRHLAGLSGLETLSVNYTQVGDAGLEHLKGLGQLGPLELLETEVTAAGLRELKKTLPRLQATVDPLKLTGLAELRGWRNSAEISDDYELLSVDLLGPKVADAWLERLRDHRSLQDVCLANAKITDAGLGHLQGLANLHTLYLSGTQITDRGMEYLKAMKKLRTLFLAETQIGDAGLAHLNGLTNLEMLLINGTRVTDAGLVHLKPLRKLTHLRFNDCQVSGAGLSHLRDLTKLTTLELNGTAVSDAGLVHVKPFANLELLYLSHTSVTDAGLGHLTGLKKLRALMVEHAHVTDQGIKSLKLALPKTSFYR